MAPVQVLVGARGRNGELEVMLEMRSGAATDAGALKEHDPEGAGVLSRRCVRGMVRARSQFARRLTLGILQIDCARDLDLAMHACQTRSDKSGPRRGDQVIEVDLDIGDGGIRTAGDFHFR